MRPHRPDPGIVVQRVEQLLGVRLEPWQAKVLHDFCKPGQRHITVTPTMRRGDWVATRLLIQFARIMQEGEARRDAAWQLLHHVAACPATNGMVSQAWVAARLEHLARYGCPGPQGKPCVHDDP